MCMYVCVFRSILEFAIIIWLGQSKQFDSLALGL